MGTSNYSLGGCCSAPSCLRSSVLTQATKNLGGKYFSKQMKALRKNLCLKSLESIKCNSTRHFEKNSRTRKLKKNPLCFSKLFYLENELMKWNLTVETSFPRFFKKKYDKMLSCFKMLKDFL